MLAVDNLFVKEKNGRYLLQDISLSLKPGQIIGLTGHSGSGKTTLVKSIMGMLHPDCRICNGQIRLDNQNLAALSARQRRDLCGTTIGFIPQTPMTAFDTRLKIGKQMVETFVLRLHLDKVDATILAKNKLKEVNLKDVDRVMESYPSQLSGGMLQRVASAILLGMAPRYVLADEPTSALDEENRDLLLNLIKKRMNDKGVLLISHDIDALKKLYSHVFVMGSGRMIEEGTLKQLLSVPQSPWTKQFAELSIQKGKGDWKWKDC